MRRRQWITAAVIMIFVCVFGFSLLLPDPDHAAAQTFDQRTEPGVLATLDLRANGLTAAAREESSLSDHLPTEENRRPQPVASQQVSPPKPVNSQLNERVHTFYYAWYGSPNVDGKWIHWNHPVLEGKQDVIHRPPDDIGSFQYPLLGPYSSADPRVIQEHMRQIAGAKIGVLSLSWYPPHMADENDGYSDLMVRPLLDAAHQFGLKICLHIEPFKGRSAASTRDAIKYAIDTYGSHPAFYRDKSRNNRPWFYLYDSYLVKDWSEIFSADSPLSIRGTKYDIVAIGLILTVRDVETHIRAHNFDGFYNYFAIDGFTEGSSFRNWNQVGNQAKKLGLVWVPCVGPGYDDVSIRPWNAKNARNRENGALYTKAWNAAVRSDPVTIAITSFNEWHEGTQIEAAVEKTSGSRVYPGYSTPNQYLDLTKDFAGKFV